MALVIPATVAPWLQSHLVALADPVTQAPSSDGQAAAVCVVVVSYVAADALDGFLGGSSCAQFSEDGRWPAAEALMQIPVTVTEIHRPAGFEESGVEVTQFSRSPQELPWLLLAAASAASSVFK